ncbi:MAG: argininosuccinate lyase [Solirubrobacterales bacterium]
MREQEGQSRFREPPDPTFWKMNRSLDGDRWLAPYDVRQSVAHASELGRLGVLDADELHRLKEALEQVALECEDGSFPELESDEDIHMAIERRLGDLVGPVAGKLHAGRSRNDQVATDLALATMDGAGEAVVLTGRLMEALLVQAEAHLDWVMPGYTHLQRAQPVYLRHHLMAYFWMLARDRDRFRAAVGSASVMPLGSGALAGVNWDLDREALATELGFQSYSGNSIDGSSNRDFVLDFLSAAAICGSHLSRLGSEIVIWSSAEFGFCALPEPFTSGSSIMPQKQNPDSAEILRGKAPVLASSFATLLGVLHGLPLTYNKDLQEDKKPLRDGIHATLGCLAMADGMVRGLVFDRERLAEAASDEWLSATEIADLLVARGVPFREAHGIVGKMVSDCIDTGRTFSDLSQEELESYSEHLSSGITDRLGAEGAIEAKRGPGSTSRENLENQLAEARALLAESPGRT